MGASPVSCCGKTPCLDSWMQRQEDPDSSLTSCPNQNGELLAGRETLPQAIRKKISVFCSGLSPCAPMSTCTHTLTCTHVTHARFKVCLLVFFFVFEREGFSV